MKFAYQAYDAAGKAVSGTVEAAETLEGIEALRRQGLFATTIEPAGESGPGATNAHRPRRFGRVRRLRLLAMFSRQVQVLVSTGTPLVETLGALTRQAKDAKWRKVVSDLRNRVEQGDSLSKAMELHPDYFDPVCRSLIAAGESSGSFDAMLDRLATLTRKQVHVYTAIRGAMIYPCLLIVVASAVLTLMFAFVLPRFSMLFQTLGVPLPPTTKFLMAISTGLREYWWAALIGVIASAGALFGWLRTQQGRYTVHTILVRGPIIGPIMRGFSTARIIRVLGVLVTGKVPLLEALQLAKQTAGNLHYSKLVADAEHAVTRGSTISSVFAESKLIEPSLTEAVRSGEQSGQIGTLLLSMADFMDDENEVIVRSLTSILEPVILIVLGVVVGFIAMSMFLPLFDLTSMTQRS
ncbi:MAG TPA: type II secretion system F family protein [Tepidisphaeraceae bacterium]|nr:type II secretion system F family protein [Tepidisphaeraceae bacterium]